MKKPSSLFNTGYNKKRQIYNPFIDFYETYSDLFDAKYTEVSKIYDKNANDIENIYRFL